MPAATTNNRLALMLAILAFMLYALCDTAAKYLTATIHPVQIGLARYAGLAVGALVLIAMRGPQVLYTRRPGLQLVRGILAALSVTTFIMALAHVPLTDAAAITFMTPFFVTLLAGLILGEQIQPFRWVAIGICFAATLVIIRPGAGAVHPAAGFAVISAACFALRQVISRKLTGYDTVQTTVCYTALAACGTLGLFLPFVWVAPADPAQWVLIAAIAVTAGGAELCIIRALETGTAVAVAPAQYTHIIWTTLCGWLVFGHLPDGWTISGALVICLTALWVLRRDSRTPPAPQPQH